MAEILAANIQNSSKINPEHIQQSNTFLLLLSNLPYAVTTVLEDAEKICAVLSTFFIAS